MKVRVIGIDLGKTVVGGDPHPATIYSRAGCSLE